MIFLYTCINRANNIEAVSMYINTIKSNMKYDTFIKYTPRMYILHNQRYHWQGDPM